MSNKISFNTPTLMGNELKYIEEALKLLKLSGNGFFTKKCQEFFKSKYFFNQVLLTSSCTDALEMAAILANINPGDEVIMPSYTFVSTANAFILRGAKLVFADSRSDHPGMDEHKVESLVTSRTKAIVVVHYAGVATDMDVIMEIAKTNNLIVIEDAAQAIDSFYKGVPLGSIGHLGAFSFHETKNVISGEGGMLTVNADEYIGRSEIIWEKGTNRSAFWRGEVDKYSWVDIGSSFLPSEITAAFLFAQLEHLDQIQDRRKQIWNQYFKAVEQISDLVQLPFVPEYATNNAHMFYLVCENIEQRTALLEHLKKNDVYAVFHYLSLHSSDYFKSQHDGRALAQSDRYTDCLVRLPLHLSLSEEDISRVINSVLGFYS
jgi:dTDP-4-amino-4,6-dideoxygalactose transaminase